MSALKKSIIMMANTGQTFELVGDKIQASAYYGSNTGLHTVQITYQNLTGGFGIQGTLSLDPSEEDWFWIHLNNQHGVCSPTPYIQYPKDPLAPTGNLSTLAFGTGAVGDSGTEIFTFIGNFTYLRAVLKRDYISPPPSENTIQKPRYGQIERVLLSV